MSGAKSWKKTLSREQVLAGPADWYRDAVVYQVHVKCFCDGSGDGMGDFKGLISKLDYLEGLGITALWLQPFYPSPLRDDGYDIADYTRVNPDYGTLADFKRLLKEAHARGMRIVTELVLNHTSDQHAWFKRARHAKPGSVNRNYYVWSDTPDRYGEARIIFQDFETSNWTWDPVAKAYFWHRFYSHQPDLNFENPKVHEEMLKVLDFWFGMGVDGMRLDAVPYLYEQEGTNCENLPSTHEFLKKLRAHIDKNHPGRMLLAEANQWPEDAASYFGNGDACHMAFHFPLMPRLYMALEMEDRYPLLDILDSTPDPPEGCQWALFLRNHDELTLEMVTDEERDYMYRIYAKDPRARLNLGIRRRLAPLLDNDRRKIELLNVMLMSLPGSPIIYYGDEIGMGDNYYLGDRDGVRTPMQWSADKNAGFSTAKPQRLYLPLIIESEYHCEAVNVENQEQHPCSLLWWMRRLIDLRKQHSAFGRGGIEFLHPENSKILAYLRIHENQTLLVAANLSRHAQMAALDLSAFSGCEPEDMFSRNRFLTVTQAPYVLTLGPYGYLVLELHPACDRDRKRFEGLPEVRVSNFAACFRDKRTRKELESSILPAYMADQRWFGGKARMVRVMSIIEEIFVGRGPDAPVILLVNVEYTEGDPEIYILPFYFLESGDEPEGVMPQGVVCRAEFGERKGYVRDAAFDKTFCREVLALIAGNRKVSGWKGKLTATSGRRLKSLLAEEEDLLSPKRMTCEQSNTSILYGEQFVLKLYRRTDKGVHPDLEMVRYLTEKKGFSHVPAYAGALEYKTAEGASVVLGLLQRYVRNQGDAWEQFQGLVSRFYERVLSLGLDKVEPPKPPSRLMAEAEDLPSPLDQIMAGATHEMSRLLGRRTAEMHQAMADAAAPAGIRPEPFSALYQRSLFQAMRNEVRSGLRALRPAMKRLPKALAQEAGAVLDLEKTIIARMQAITDKRITSRKIRIHGDYHLGQVLYTGRDYVIFDFEGEPVRPLSERRLKRAPLRDVAGMMRSFQYAAYTPLIKDSAFREEDARRLEPWADLWSRHAGGAFLGGYVEAMAQTPAGALLIPKDTEVLEDTLTPYLLQKAVYERGYELNNRPGWRMVPLRGILDL